MRSAVCAVARLVRSGSLKKTAQNSTEDTHGISLASITHGAGCTRSA